MTGHALRDWCRSSATNHSRVRDELLNVEQFACLTEAQVLIADWHEDYNQRRPHSSLGRRTPAAFAAAWTAGAAA